MNPKNVLSPLLLLPILLLTACPGFDGDPTPLDMTPPAAVTDLAGSMGPSPGVIAVSWTATGDDGSVGNASAYEVKYATFMIDATNFDTATTYPQNWQPLPAGNLENHSLSGLPPGQTFYLAIRVLDEVPNVSSISNVISAPSRPGPDVVPPAGISDLSAQPG
ncbi:MAG: hypothetical protein ACYTHN_16875, partial [Planctomycetota bacterium]